MFDNLNKSWHESNMKRCYETILRLWILFKIERHTCENIFIEQNVKGVRLKINKCVFKYLRMRKREIFWGRHKKSLRSQVKILRVYSRKYSSSIQWSDDVDWTILYYFCTTNTTDIDEERRWQKSHSFLSTLACLKCCGVNHVHLTNSNNDNYAESIMQKI